MAGQVKVDTSRYELSHGRKPRQARWEGIGAWAFQIDTDEDPVLIYANYHDALKQAKHLAQHIVTVLP